MVEQASVNERETIKRVSWRLMPLLEHIPPGSNRGDSQRWVDERVWRP
jgi:hypothetical protein